MADKFRGTIKHWNDEKGYGFVGFASRPDTFMHAREWERCSGSEEPPEIGTRVVVEIGPDRKSGRERVMRCELEGPEPILTAQELERQRKAQEIDLAWMTRSKADAAS